MDHRTALKSHDVLAFEGMTCHIEEVIGQGSNSIVYKGWYSDSLHPELGHHVLIKELFPNHPEKKIRRAEDGQIVVEPEAQELWALHKESFEAGNRVHLRLLHDHPEMMVMGANINSFHYNGTLYSVLGYSGGRSLQAELKKSDAPLRQVVLRMIGLLDALEAFHKSSYLHLDISPDNIMLVGSAGQERLFLIDYNSTLELGNQEIHYFSSKTGYPAPEVTIRNLKDIGFASDLYSVAAVFFCCLMGRILTLEEILRAKAPDARESPLLHDVPQPVRRMVATILKKGLHTLASRRYQSIGQMRQAFQELLDRIDCVGITHWALWENGKRSMEELIRNNPSLRYLKEENRLYPIRLEREKSMTLDEYLEGLLSPTGKSGMILAQGGMGKTTLLLHTAMLRGKRYSPAAPAVFYLSLNGWDGVDAHYICSQILMRLRYKKEENTYDGAMHALHQLLGQTISAKNGEIPKLLLLLDGLNEVHADPAPLVREINELGKLAGVRILAASRSELPQLALETAALMPLNPEDVEEALGNSGLLIPKSRDTFQLLRTPLILSLYIQTSEGGKQLDIRSEEELMKAYMAALLEKEIRQLPEDAPLRWQTDIALNYVLPAIAIEMKHKNTALSQQQLLAVVDRCWKTLKSRKFRKAYPDWIGHSPDFCADAKNAEEWLGIMVHSLLWKRLGMLTRDDSGNYRIYHQAVAEYLAGYRIPVTRTAIWPAALILILVLAVAAVGYRQYLGYVRQQAAEAEIREVLEFGAAGYVEYGAMFRQLGELMDYASTGDSANFQTYYDRVLRFLEQEAKTLPSEQTEARQAEQTIGYDQLMITWGERENAYEYDVLTRLLAYPDERAAFYAEQLPLLKTWVESESLQGKIPEFPGALSSLLKADAALAAEMYQRAVGVHLSGTDEQWLEKMNALVALIPELDAHRDTSVREDRGQKLQTLQSAYLTAEGKYETQRTKINAYIRNLTQSMQTETMELQSQLEQISQMLN